jgi:CDGSH-type Zn-finger protein
MAITTVDSLRRHLQWAIEVEHGTLPPYLCALYSIKDGANTESAEVIHSVFMEEMLHLTMAANILNAVGGTPVLDAPSLLPPFPTYLPHSSREFQVPLLKFSPEAIDVFLRIERPAEHDGLPEDNRFETIGQFYEAIEVALKHLSETMGEEALFCGDPARQVTDEIYYGGSGRIITVTNLESALAALAEIVEQGEGLQHEEVWDGDRDMFHPEREEVAHYFRFQEIALGRRFQPGDTPQSGPTGETFPVDWDAVHNMRPNPRSSDYPLGSEQRVAMEAFNHAYSGVLHLLHETFNGSPSLLAVATGLMYGLKQQAVDLMQLPSGDGETTVGPSFEYVPPELRHIAHPGEQRIVILHNGPYLVYGDVPLVRKRKVTSVENHDAITWMKTETLETEETYALCRCGMSSTKPFCDGTHARAAFDGTEVADPRPSAERRRVVGGSGFVVRRDGPLCMHAAFCVGRLERIPAMLEGTSDSDARARVIALIDRCPSGSYTYSFEEDGPDIEPDYPVQITVTEEERGLAGALWVTGGIPITRSDGVPFETRNRVTLCRCGHSENKPLCDGTHRQIGFTETGPRLEGGVANAASQHPQHRDVGVAPPKTPA